MITTDAELEQRIGELMVRHHYTRHAATGIALALVDPSIITAEFVEHPITYVRNPHTVSTVASAALVVLAGVGVAWSEYRDYPHVGLVFLTLLVLVGLLVTNVRRFNAWEQG